jgi:D-alanine-D-alanine ligase
VLGDPRLPDPVKRGGRFNAEDLEVVARLRDALATLPAFSFSYVDDHGSLIKTLSEQRPDLVLNLCDEGFGNDASRELHVPAVLDLLGLPYTGAGPVCLALCARKHDVRAIAQSMGIAVPDEIHVPGGHALTSALTFPLFVKPAASDGSFGITRASIVHTPDELRAQLERMPRCANGDGAIVQQWLPGREYSVAFLDYTGVVKPLPILEVDYAALPTSLPRMLPDEAKWDPESPYWTDIRYSLAQLDGAREARLTLASRRLFERLGCRGYARFDFREDDRGEPRLLEVNPNPGWCWDGKMNLMAGWSGLSYAEFLRAILEAGWAARLSKSRER